MVTLKGLMRTFTVSKAPYAVLTLKLSKNSSFITFRNGCRFKLTFAQFRTLRDSYSFMKNYPMQQLNDDLFSVDFGTLKLTESLAIVCMIGDLLQKYDIKKVNENLFRIKSDKLELVGSWDIMQPFWEIINGMYSCDCKGKVVLDIGGFQGESAVYFSSIGAKKVVIYEPVPSNFEFIERNVSLNYVNAETHLMGIGSKDGTQTIHFEKINAGLGSKTKGQFEMQIKLRNISDVIDESGAEVAKIDCEGAEESLIGVSDEILGKIRLYMIEVHSSEIRRALLEKFQAAGFSRFKEKNWGNPELSVVFFEKNEK
ncbi:MAG: FkbM family methyltransferase [Candidatus Bathyarchaeia archaeon]